jgi:hypothetical protein
MKFLLKLAMVVLVLQVSDEKSLLSMEVLMVEMVEMVVLLFLKQKGI